MRASARRGPSAWLVAGLLLALSVGAARAAPRAREIKADGRWHSFRVSAPEQVHTFRFEIRAGCRYRLTTELVSLDRALVEVGPGDTTVWRGDSRPPDGGETDDERRGKPAAVITWDAENSGVLEARARGFSAMTGRARLRLETLGPDDVRVAPHRRLLAPGGTLARVGSLWVGQADDWELVVEAGRRYEVRTRPGTAGRVTLSVVASTGDVLATGEPTHGAPWPSVAFEVPLAPPRPNEEEEAAEPEPTTWRLEVRSADGGGGSYGVRLLEDPPSRATVEPPVEPSEETGPTGPIGDVPLGFRVAPGDLAVLYLERADPRAPHFLQVRTAEGWKTLPFDELTAWGRRASMRTPESAAMVWFRAYRGGVYRFVERGAHGAVLKIWPAARVPRAPLLLGTGEDPSIPARVGSSWKTVGVGVCMPGWDYLFVAVGRRRGSVAMRARGVDDTTFATRPRRGVAQTRVAGLGPSLRFRVKEPTLVQLQVKGGTWTGYALLRRGSD